MGINTHTFIFRASYNIFYTVIQTILGKLLIIHPKINIFPKFCNEIFIC